MGKWLRSVLRLARIKPAMPEPRAVAGTGPEGSPDAGVSGQADGEAPLEKGEPVDSIRATEGQDGSEPGKIPGLHRTSSPPAGLSSGDATTLPAQESREPEAERGEAGHDTPEVARSAPGDQEPAGALSVAELIKKLVHDSRTENRRAAAEALGQLGPAAGAAVLPLLQCFTASDPVLRQAVVRALGAIDPDWRRHEAVQDAMPLWARELRRGVLELNNDLSKQLALIGAPAVPRLARALADAGDVVGNVFVLRALGRMGPDAARAVPEIAHLLESQYSQVRIAAAEALERIGPAAAPAIPALRAGLSHWNSDVRRAIAHCLAHIDPAGRAGEPGPRQAGPSTRSPLPSAIPVELAGLLAMLSQPGRSSDMPDRVQLGKDALALAKRDENPVVWASLQNEVGKSLAFSPRGDPAGNIELAIHHFKRALEVFTPEAYPQDWAMVQNNLAAAYRKRRQGERAENIELAISCCQQALEVRTRESDPEGWATTHNNLANAYRDRIHGDRAENVEQALRHCELALGAFTPQAHPWKWATAQNNLANAYQDRVCGDRAENLEHAIHHCQEALRVFSRAAYPQDWAWTHNNLGTSYHARVRGDRADNLEQAIHHFEQALQVYTRQSIPGEWAVAHNNVGNAYQDRVRGEPEDNLDKAISHYKQALTVFTRQSDPVRWAAIQAQLAGAEEKRTRAAARPGEAHEAHPPTLSYPQFYEEESRLQPGERRRLELIFSKSPDSKYEISLVLVYQWDAEISEEEAGRLLLRAVAYLSCAIYDAARNAGLACRASEIPNGRRPAWVIANERVPISLTLSDMDMSDKTCRLSIAPIVVEVGPFPVNAALLARLLEGFRARFSTISV